MPICLTGRIEYSCPRLSVFKSACTLRAPCGARGKNLGFAGKPGHAIGFMAEGFAQHFHCHLASRVRIGRAPHFAHASFTEPGDDANWAATVGGSSLVSLPAITRHSENGLKSPLRESAGSVVGVLEPKNCQNPVHEGTREYGRGFVATLTTARVL